MTKIPQSEYLFHHHFRQTETERELQEIIEKNLARECSSADFIVELCRTVENTFLELAPCLINREYPGYFTIKEVNDSLITNYFEVAKINTALYTWLNRQLASGNEEEDAFNRLDDTPKTERGILTRVLEIAETDARVKDGTFKSPRCEADKTLLAEYILKVIDDFASGLLEWDRENALKLFHIIKGLCPNWITGELWHIAALDLYEWFTMKNELTFYHFKEFYDIADELQEKIQDRIFTLALRYQTPGDEWFWEPFSALANVLDPRDSDICIGFSRSRNENWKQCVLKLVLAKANAANPETAAEDVVSAVDGMWIHHRKPSEMSVTEEVCDALELAHPDKGDDIFSGIRTVRRSGLQDDKDEDEDDEEDYVVRENRMNLVRCFAKNHGMDDEKAEAAGCAVFAIQGLKDRVEDSESARKAYVDAISSALSGITGAEYAKSAAQYMLSCKLCLSPDWILESNACFRRAVKLEEYRNRLSDCPEEPDDWKSYAEILKTWFTKEDVIKVNQAARTVALKFRMFENAAEKNGFEEEWTYERHVVLREEISGVLGWLDWRRDVTVLDHVVQLLYEKVCEDHGLIPCVGCE